MNATITLLPQRPSKKRGNSDNVFFRPVWLGKVKQFVNHRVDSILLALSRIDFDEPCVHPDLTKRILTPELLLNDLNPCDGFRPFHS